jgi:hypothetical protein
MLLNDPPMRTARAIIVQRGGASRLWQMLAGPDQPDESLIIPQQPGETWDALMRRAKQRMERVEASGAQITTVELLGPPPVSSNRRPEPKRQPERTSGVRHRIPSSDQAETLGGRLRRAT